MQKFETPKMSMVKLEVEDVMRTSACFEAHACLDCYCSAVQCSGIVECNGLNCPTLSDYD